VLRRWLRQPAVYAWALTAVVAAVAWDSGRLPERQATARAYIAGVKAYQAVVGPLMRPFVECRYRPTCSEYSIEAVARFGIRRGLILTAGRVLSCRPSVPRGTLDPVPQPPAGGR